MNTPTMQQIAAMAGLKPVAESKPLLVLPLVYDGRGIIEANGKRLANISNYCEHNAPLAAEEIVRRCNSFDDLLAACKAALPYLLDSGGTAEPLAHETVEAAIRKAQSGHATITLLWFIGFASAAFLWMLWSLMKAAL